MIIYNLPNLLKVVLTALNFGLETRLQPRSCWSELIIVVGHPLYLMGNDLLNSVLADVHFNRCMTGVDGGWKKNLDPTIYQLENFK